MTRLTTQAALVLTMLAASAIESPALAAGPLINPGAGHSIQWNPNPDTDMKDYLVFLSPTSGGYLFTAPWMTIPHPTALAGFTGTSPKPTEGQNFACVKARDLAMNQSACSNEVAFLYDSVIPAAPVIKIVIASWDEDAAEYLTIPYETFLHRITG